MGATPLDFRERVAALRGAGLSPVQIGHRLHYSVGYVHQAIADLENRTPAPRPRGVYAPWVRPDPNAEDRRAALERGRRLALRKVARGEWVRPDGGAR